MTDDERLEQTERVLVNTLLMCVSSKYEEDGKTLPCWCQDTTVTGPHSQDCLDCLAACKPYLKLSPENG